MVIKTKNKINLSDDDIKTLREGDNNIEYTIIGSSIGKGSTGNTYLVQEKGTEKYVVLKECHLEDQSNRDLFLSEAKEMMGVSLNHFIKIHKVGTIVENGREAYIMDYGGSDVAQLYTYLENVPATVRDAVSYKIMYTVVCALEDAHNKKVSHGDILLRNILSGIDLGELQKSIQDGKSMSELYTRLVVGEIRLCDRTISGNLGTRSLPNSELKGEEKKIEDYLNDTTAKNLFQSDVYAAVALCSLLIDRQEKAPVPNFAQDFFGIEQLGKDRKTGVVSYPTLTGLKQMLEEKILKEHDGYFALTSGIHGYPVVLRPLDRFILEWNEKESGIKNLNQLNQLYDSHAISYVAMRDFSTDTYYTDNEKNDLKLVFSRILDTVVDNTLGLIRQNNEVLTPLLQKEHILDEEIQTIIKDVSTLRTKLDETEQTRKNLVQILENNDDDATFEEFNTVRERQKLERKSLTQLDHKLSVQATEKKGVLEQKEIYSNQEYFRMLQYVHTTCLSEVSVQFKDKISEKITPFISNK